MPGKTTTLNLNKPLGSEVVDIDVLNENMDILDTTVKDVQDFMTQTEADLASAEARITALDNAATGIAAEERRRVTAESNRVTAEDTRIANETGRVSAEQARVTAENQRVAAETARAAAEANRVSAETAREQVIEGFVDTTDANKKDAEAYAVGTRGGTDVPDTDPTYHNNAKYYAGQASADAEAAEAAKTTAVTTVETAIGNIRTEGTTQVSAVQTKGTEVLDSIPDDYETLSTDVSALKSAVNNEPITKTYTLTKGRYIYSRQTIGQPPVLDSSAGKHCIIDASDIKNGGSYKIVIDEITANSTISTVFLDENGNVQAKNVTYSGNIQGFMVLNPETGKYERNTPLLTRPINKICFSIYGGSNTLEFTYKNPNTYNPETVFVKDDGSDNNSGLSATYPFQTLNKAIESGAKNISILSDLNDNVSIDKDVNIYGNGHTVYGDTVLTTETYNEILRAPYTADTRITNCFIDKTTPLTETVSGSGWKGPRYNIACYADDQKLLPVEDISTCESTDNSFTWVDGYFYIHATGTRFSYVTKSNVLSITAGNVKITDLSLKHSYSNILSASGCDLELNACKAIGSINMNCVTVENGNLIARDVETAYSWNDGLNTHGRGDSTIINCYCHDCSDDGISQHDNTTGVIIGGEFCRCGKGGISSPINSAKVDIYNAYVHDNTGSQAYGIYASNSSGTTKTFRVFNSVISNNRIGLKIVGHQMLSYGNKLTGNTTDVSTESGGTITEL